MTSLIYFKEKTHLFILFLRLEDWVSKLPGLFTAVLPATLVMGSEITTPLLLTIAFTVGHLSTGYIANDLADWEMDRKASDYRIIHSMSYFSALVLFAFCSILSFIPVLLVARDSFYLWCIFISIYALHMAYSFPPRLKSKGWFGIISSSVNQWCVPFFVLSLQVDYHLSEMASLIIILWLFLLGCNGAVRHQINDFDKDKGQVKNMVQVYGISYSRSVITKIRFLTSVIPLFFLFLLPLNQALVSILSFLSFDIYHTRYYKKIRSYQ